MIPKLTSGDHFYGVLFYLENKKAVEVAADGQDEAVAKQEGSTRIGAYHLLADQTDKAASLSKLFEQYNQAVMKKGSRTQKAVFHASLSLKAGETINNERFLQVAASFMEQMGYGEQPYVVYRHYDKAHPHIHIVSSRVGANGKKINDSNEAKRAIKICRQLEQQYGLSVVQQFTIAQEQSADLAEVQVKGYAAPPPYHPQMGFRQAIRNHLHYALKVKGVTDLRLLQGYFVAQNMSVELQGGTVKFYGLNSAGEAISHLSGGTVMKDCSGYIDRQLKDNTKKIGQSSGHELKDGVLANTASVQAALEGLLSYPFVHRRHITAVLESAGMEGVVREQWIPNGAKVLQINQRATKAFEQLSILCGNGMDMDAAVAQLQKRNGYMFQAGLNKQGRIFVLYKEKGCRLFAERYLGREVKEGLLKLFTGASVYERYCKGQGSDKTPRLEYLKVDGPLNALLSPKVATAYRLLLQNARFGASAVHEAAKKVGLTMNIHEDKSGLKGLTIQFNGYLVKVGDLQYEGKPLSSLLLKEGYMADYNGAVNLKLNGTDKALLALHPPELQTQLGDIVVKTADNTWSMATAGDQGLKLLLNKLKEKYVTKASLKSGLLPYHRQPNKQEMQRKQTHVKNMVDRLRNNIINRGEDDLNEDIYKIKIR
jgi:hypothetical protein